MKIKIKNLKKIINETLTNDSQNHVEITTNPELAKNSWPDVSYNNVDFFGEDDLFYKITEPQNDDPDVRKQQVYLGYVPSRDVFVVGYDCSAGPTKSGNEDNEDEFYAEYRYVKVNLDHTGRQIESIIDDEHPHRGYTYQGGFYSNFYKELKHNQPSIIDLQLD